MNQYRVHFPALDAAPAITETVDLSALRAERGRLGERVDKGIALLRDLARQGGQDSPGYNRCFAEWEKLFTEETQLLEEIDALERGASRGQR
ncbi:MAG TPA: hypothetical protein VF932_18205 [Anaerolineae bacterium]